MIYFNFRDGPRVFNPGCLSSTAIYSLSGTFTLIAEGRVYCINVPLAVCMRKVMQRGLELHQLSDVVRAALVALAAAS